MLARCVVVLVVVLSVAGDQFDETSNMVSPNNRRGRFGIIKALLPYINLKIKTPFECNTGRTFNGNPIVGTCMSGMDCTSSGGKVDGVCAEGYGSCCVHEASCGATVERNRTYLINNGSFTNGQFSCQYNIKKPRDLSTQFALYGACQVRIDFEEFNLGQPDQTTSLCSNDSFEITNNNAAFGKICGSNMGQHIYLPIGNSDTIATLVFSGSSASTVSRNWRLKTTYIPCLSNMTAPPGCLQYFDKNSGNIQSFNYQSGGASSVAQIGSLRYSICVGEMDGSCGVSYVGNDFSLTGASATPTPSKGAACTTDYISVITEAANGLTAPDSKYCGTKLDKFDTYARPFSIRVITDAVETGDTTNKGFNIAYSRLSCSTLTSTSVPSAG